MNKKKEEKKYPKWSFDVLYRVLMVFWSAVKSRMCDWL